MYYHAVIRFNADNEFWSNKDYNELLTTVVIPYINGQTVLLDREDGKFVVNFGATNFLSVFKTDKKLTAGFDKAWKEWPGSEFKRTDCTQQIVDEALKLKWATKTRSPIELGLLETDPLQVFVIMKFGDEVIDSAYDGVIRPIVRSFKYHALRIDEVQDGGRISQQILREIARSVLVLADLTGERPNCYYEAGFAHAIGKELIFTISKKQSHPL